MYISALMLLGKVEYAKRIHNGCSGWIENYVTRAICLATQDTTCDAKQLYWWQNFQSAPHNHYSYIPTSIKDSHQGLIFTVSPKATGCGPRPSILKVLSTRAHYMHSVCMFGVPLYCCYAVFEATEVKTLLQVPVVVASCPKVHWNQTLWNYF